MPLGRARHEVRLRDSRVSQAFNSLVSDLRLTPVPERLSFLEEYKCYNKPIMSSILPQAKIFLILHQSHDGPVDRLVVGGVPNVKVFQSPAPLLDQKLQPVLAAAGHTAP